MSTPLTYSDDALKAILDSYSAVTEEELMERKRRYVEAAKCGLKIAFPTLITAEELVFRRKIMDAYQATPEEIAARNKRIDEAAKSPIQIVFTADESGEHDSQVLIPVVNEEANVNLQNL